MVKKKEEGLTFENKATLHNVGDVCLYDKKNDKLIVTEGTSKNLKEYPLDEYVPIGVVVIPSSHDVYGTGECGVMSLNNMSHATPDNGYLLQAGEDHFHMMTENESIPYGGKGESIDGLCVAQTEFDKDFRYPPMATTVIESKNGEVFGNSSYVHIPSDVPSHDTIVCEHDKNASYSTQIIYLFYPDPAPSPYLTDGSRNPTYYTTTDLSGNKITNALSDLDGLKNTNLLTESATTQVNWKTDSEILPDTGRGYYPAACCCWRYHTEGTKQGDWYLPSIGELGYVLARLHIIDKTFKTLLRVYKGLNNMYFDNKEILCSSTECGEDFFAEAMACNSTIVTFEHKDSYFRAVTRAFLRVV